MRRILLTGIGSPPSQNFLACLRMAPEPFYIVGADANRYHLEWGELDAAYEAPMTADPAYLGFLNGLIEKEGIEFVHGQADWEVAFLANHAAGLNARTFYPHLAVIALAQDKHAAVTAWGKAGLRRDAPSLLEIGTDLPREWGDYPLWIRATRGAGARGSCLARDWQEAAHWTALWDGDPTIQFVAEEYLPGREFAFQSLWHKGILVCSAARERVEKTMNLQMGERGATSSPIVARSVHDDAVNATATNAILALDAKPHGIYSVDLKEDSRGVVRPTECNAGRFFTTSLFLAKGGCNIPYWFVKLGLGGPVPELPRYNAVPAGLLWIRHIDCGQVLVKDGEWRSVAWQR